MKTPEELRAMIADVQKDQKTAANLALMGAVHERKDAKKNFFYLSGKLQGLLAAIGQESE